MSKRKGPFLITDLASKLGSAPSPVRSPQTVPDTNHARSAYGFIAENYKNTPSGPETAPIGSDSISNKTDSKPGTNREQTGNRSENKLGTNWEQIGNKTENSSSPVLAAPVQTGNKPGAQPGTLSRTNREQTGNKPGTAARFLSLSGLQRGTVLFLYSLCRAGGTRTTENVRLEAIASNLETTPGAIKETIKRLIVKEFIQRADYRAGRGGFSSYTLPEEIYRQLFELETGNKLGTFREHSGNKLGTQPGTQLGTSVPSSSSSIDLENLKTTTTSESDFFTNDPLKLSPEWEALDFSSLSEIGFTQSHLIQIARQGKVSAPDAQESIEYFSFDLKRNQKAKNLNGSALNFFMGILRKGIPYAPPENYESPADEARRKKREVLTKLDAKRRAEESEIEELEFQAWKTTLTADQKKQLVPWSEREGSPGHEAGLREYFKNQRQAGEESAEAQAIGQQIESSLAMTSSLQGGI